MRSFVVCIILVIATAAMVYAHCHTTADCENVVQHLYMMYWDTPNGNTAKYYVNPDHPGKPSLTATVNAAATKWRNVNFQNETIPFNPEYKGETTEFEAGDFDGLNVFDWVGLRDKNGKNQRNWDAQPFGRRKAMK